MEIQLFNNPMDITLGGTFEQLRELLQMNRITNFMRTPSFEQLVYIYSILEDKIMFS